MTDTAAPTFADQRVFVTGATGFIGSHLVRRLVAEGAQVSVLVRAGSNTVRLADTIEGLIVHEGDLSQAEALRRILRSVSPRYIFHLAAFTTVAREWSHRDPALRVNLEGTMHLTEAMQGLDIASMVNSGSNEEYGSAPPPTAEDAPLDPVSPYSVAKAAATLWCRMLHRTQGAPIVTVRPFLAYGPGQEPVRLIPQAIVAALANRDFPMTGGEQTRDFVHVSDLVDGYLRAASCREAHGEVINLASGQECTVRDLVRRVFDITGSRGAILQGAVPSRPAEMWRCGASIEKARRLLGWAPRIGLEAGLRDTIDWYRAHWPALAADPS